MYNYASLNKTNEGVDTFSPVDNMSINGTPLNELVEGYRHLTVNGRGLVGQTVKTTSVPGRRGVWVDDYSDNERELEIKYKLEANTSSEMRDRFAKLNKVLRDQNVEGDGLIIQFADEPDYYYRGYFVEADDIEETSLSIISKFRIIVPDGYKKKAADFSTGPIHLTDAEEVLPQFISVVINKENVDTVQIANDDKILSFTGSYARGKEIIVDWNDDEITATYDGRNILHELERFSPLETFKVRDGDVITAINADVKSVVWRDERL